MFYEELRGRLYKNLTYVRLIVKKVNDEKTLLGVSKPVP